MSVNKRQLGALLLTMFCVFMVASINCANITSNQKIELILFLFLVWIISYPTLNVAISGVLVVTFFFISIGPHYLSSAYCIIIIYFVYTLL